MSAAPITTARSPSDNSTDAYCQQEPNSAPLLGSE